MNIKVDNSNPQDLVDLIDRIILARQVGIAQASVEINTLLFDADAKEYGRGRPPTTAAQAQKDVLQLFNRIERFFPSAQGNDVFHKYLSNLTLQAFRAGQYKSELPFQEALIEFAVTAFDLYTESGVPNSIIKSHAHKFSVSQVALILKEAREIFGDDKDSEPLVRTAAFQVFMKKYASITEAKSAYDTALSEARKLFGDDKDSEPLVRTAAFQVFMKKYASMTEAKSAYDAMYDEAFSICRVEKSLTEKASSIWAVKIAHRVFTSNSKNIRKAIEEMM